MTWIQSEESSHDVSLPLKNAAPRLAWLPICELRFNSDFRRNDSSNRSIISDIARKFDWSRFHPMIVVACDGSRYNVIDGQRRGRAAAICGAAFVPCSIITGAEADWSDIFAALNPILPSYRPAAGHRARLSAGEVKAVYVQSICDEAGIRIAYNRPAKAMKFGETNAVSSIYAMSEKYNRGIVVSALKAIINSSGDTPGLIRGETIRAFCLAISELNRGSKRDDYGNYFREFALEKLARQIALEIDLDSDMRCLILSNAIIDYIKRCG